MAEAVLNLDCLCCSVFRYHHFSHRILIFQLAATLKRSHVFRAICVEKMAIFLKSCLSLYRPCMVLGHGVYWGLAGENLFSPLLLSDDRPKPSKGKRHGKPHGKWNHIAVLNILGVLARFAVPQTRLTLLLLLCKLNCWVFRDGTLLLKHCLVC